MIHSSDSVRQRPPPETCTWDRRAMPEPINVGVVGCGAISAAYFKMAPNFPILRMVACADLEREKAEARAREFGIPRVLAVEELLGDPEIDLVLNLTVPKAHVPVALRALE